MRTKEGPPLVLVCSLLSLDRLVLSGMELVEVVLVKLVVEAVVAKVTEGKKAAAESKYCPAAQDPSGSWVV
jgi:hypothetical protein